MLGKVSLIWAGLVLYVSAALSLPETVVLILDSDKIALPSSRAVGIATNRRRCSITEGSQERGVGIIAL